MKNVKNICVLSTAIASAFGFSSNSFSATPTLEEIVVTAQRRSENIQDVPIAVLAASQEMLENYGVSNVADLDMVFNGVQVKDFANYIFPFVRGIGSFVQSGSANSSVAVYLDGVFQPRLSGTALELANVQQVEILKGPQATLYGRNATGGTVKITTKTSMPGEEFNGNVSATVGDYNEKNASFYFGGGLSDTFALNVSGITKERDGFVKNLASSNVHGRFTNPIGFDGPVPIYRQAAGEDLDNVDKFYINGKLTWTPTENLLVTLAAHRSQLDDTEGSALTQVAPELAAGFADVVLAGFLGQTPPESYNFATKKWEDYCWSCVTYFDDKGYVLSAQYQMGDIEIRSLTSANEIDASGSNDAINVNLPVFGFNGIQDSKNFSQDLQITAVDGEGIDWMIGANYFTEESDGEARSDILGTMVGSGEEQLIQIVGGLPIIGASSRWEAEAMSLFGEIYYDLTEKLSLTLGLRYTDESFDAVATFDNSGLPINQPSTFEDDSYTWRMVLDYETDFGMVYGSVSTGFKSGGINAANVPAGSFPSEEITAYEVGLKSTLADGAMILNAAAFIYDFENIQTQVVGGATGGANFFLAGDQADLQGIEVEFQGYITENFSLQAGGTWLLEREYTDFEVPFDPVTFTPGVSASGNDIVGAAEFNALLGAQYVVGLNDMGSITLSSNVNYSSGYFHTVDNLVGTGGFMNDDGYIRVNARITYLSPEETFEAALWSTNVTNEFFYSSGITFDFAGQASRQAHPGEPRQVGLTVKYNF